MAKVTRKVLIVTLTFALVCMTETTRANALFGIGDCRNLKSRVLKQDVIGRTYWDKYQVELGNLARFGNGYSATDLIRRQNQIQVVGRLILQILISDKKIYSDMTKFPKCLKEPKKIGSALSDTQEEIKFFRGEIPDSQGTYFKNYLSFNLNYYSEYYDAIDYLK